MKEAKVKKIIWGGVYSNPKNMLMYIMYTDMTYEEYRVNLGMSQSCPVDGNHITYKAFIYTKHLIGMTKKEAYEYIEKGSKMWRDFSEPILKEQEEKEKNEKKK